MITSFFGVNGTSPGNMFNRQRIFEIRYYRKNISDGGQQKTCSNTGNEYTQYIIACCLWLEGGRILHGLPG